MDKLSNIETFILFCLEAYKNKEQISGTEAINKFKRFEILNYLEQGYDLLHTQSLDYIVDEIKEYIKERE